LRRNKECDDDEDHLFIFFNLRNSSLINSLSLLFILDVTKGPQSFLTPPIFFVTENWQLKDTIFPMA
jgi:hypothetical protein